MPDNDLELLICYGREAGDIARGYFERGADSWDKPGDAGPVTEADLAVDRHLKERLLEARPGYGWLSEETPDTTARLSTQKQFIVDPIDGTRSFVAGQKTWAHSLAVAEDGEVTAGVIYLPMLDQLYTAERGGGATLFEADRVQTLTTSDQTRLDMAQILCAKPNMDVVPWKDGNPPQFARAHRPSLAYRMALVAKGRFDGMLTLRPTWEWDIAAGVLIAKEAGATVTGADGKPLKFNSKSAQTAGVLSAAPAIHDAIHARLAPQEALTAQIERTPS